MTDERIPLAAALPGLEIHALPEGWAALEAIVLVKCLDPDGYSSWAFRTTAGLNDEELLGAITVRRDILRKELLDLYEADQD